MQNAFALWGLVGTGSTSVPVGWWHLPGQRFTSRFTPRKVFGTAAERCRRALHRLPGRSAPPRLDRQLSLVWRRHCLYCSYTNRKYCCSQEIARQNLQVLTLLSHHIVFYQRFETITRANKQKKNTVFCEGVFLGKSVRSRSNPSLSATTWIAPSASELLGVTSSYFC